MKSRPVMNIVPSGLIFTLFHRYDAFITLLPIIDRTYQGRLLPYIAIAAFLTFNLVYGNKSSHKGFIQAH